MNFACQSLISHISYLTSITGLSSKSRYLLTLTYLFRPGRIECSTLLAQVAKISQGLIPPSFLISSAKVQDILMKSKCKGELSVSCCQLSEISYPLSVASCLFNVVYILQVTDNRQQVTQLTSCFRTGEAALKTG